MSLLVSQALRALRAPRHARVAALVTLTALAGGALAPAAGDASSPRPQIVGGTDASIGTLPYLAFISGQFPDGTGESCSGTVVAPRLVLTAAHCVESLDTGRPYPVSGLAVTTGTADVAGDGGQSTEVTRAIVDPDFHAPSQDDDAALLVLAQAVRAPAITLATTPPADGTAGIVAGWGEISGDALDAPSLLRQAPADVLDPAACTIAWGVSFDPATELCTLDQADLSSGACSGDSGGPLLAQVDGATAELGLAIYVATGCVTSAPDVYTRADAISGWVGAVIAALPSPAGGVSSSTATAPRTPTHTTAVPATTAATPGPLLHVARNAAVTGRQGLAAARLGR